MDLFELLKQRYNNKRALVRDLGINLRTLYRWEQGHWGPSKEVQEKMLTLLNGQPRLFSSNREEWP